MCDGRCFPDATVWLQPGQWSFPLPFPLQLIGFPSGRRLRTLPTRSPSAASSRGSTARSSSVAGKEPGEAAPPWATELPFEGLGPLSFPLVGAFGEPAFCRNLP